MEDDEGEKRLGSAGLQAGPIIHQTHKKFLFASFGPLYSLHHPFF